MRHAVVIGAGIVGLSTALELRRRDFDVTVVERDGVDRVSTSHGNAGIVVPSHFVPLAAPGVVRQALRWMADPASPFYVRPRLDLDLLTWSVRFWKASNRRHVERSSPALLALNLAGRQVYDELANELGRKAIAFRDHGLWMLCSTRRGLDEEAVVAEQARGLGLRAVVLDGDAVRAAEPNIDLAIEGAVHFPDDANMDPAAVMCTLQQRLARDDGVRLAFGTRVTRILVKHGRVRGLVVTRSATSAPEPTTLEADVVVIAAGAWSAQLARDVGVRLLLQPGKGYALTVSDPSQTLRTPAILVEARASASTVGAAFRIGGTMELAGFDGRATDVRLEGVRRAAQRYFPSLPHGELANASVWAGFRPLSPDGLPYLGAVPGVRGALIGTGHAMMGFSAGPISGRVLAQLAAGERATIDLDAFRVNRHGAWLV